MSLDDRPRRVSLLIEGVVQGVFYRQSTRHTAEKLGLTGWVQNLPDGRVAAEVEGSAANVQALIDWCHHGPPAARVTNVIVEERPLEGNEQGFSVRR